jgi:hypothetical protein
VRRDPLTTALGLTALAGALTAIVLIGTLTLTVEQVDPVRRTISEYGVLDRYEPIFGAGVLAFVAAIVCTLGALARVRAATKATTAGLVLAALGLAAVVVFEKTNWAVGPSLGGYVHRYASLVAFVALPVAALATRSRAARVLALLSLAWFAVIAGAFLVHPNGWWQVIPLGIVERGTACAEVLTVAALAIHAMHSRVPGENPRGVPALDAG